jgi:hypothetical protein
MFTRMLEQSMTVRRLSTTTGIKRVYGTLGPYACLLQPLDDKTTDLHGLAMGHGYKLFSDLEADVKEGDEVVVNGMKLKVSGIKVYNFGDYQHKEMIVYTEASAS